LNHSYFNWFEWWGNSVYMKNMSFKKVLRKLLLDPIVIDFSSSVNSFMLNERSRLAHLFKVYNLFDCLSTYHWAAAFFLLLYSAAISPVRIDLLFHDRRQQKFLFFLLFLRCLLSFVEFLFLFWWLADIKLMMFGNYLIVFILAEYFIDQPLSECSIVVQIRLCLCLRRINQSLAFCGYFSINFS